MFRRKKLYFVVIIFSFFVNLFFVSAGNTDPLTITGSAQMSVNGTQTLTATGGSGGYNWIMPSGGGELSSPSGDSTNYTAPSSNPNCANNPAICVTDSTGQKVCKQIAVNAVFGGAPVTYLWFYKASDCIKDPWGGVSGCPSGSSCWRGKLTCWVIDGYCDGTEAPERWYTCNKYCNCISPDECLAKNTPKFEDARGDTKKSMGCCPATLPGGGTDGTHNKGNTCTSENISSSANLKSGNLYHSQDVGNLTFSYNSIDSYNGTLGNKWTHNYDLKLTALSDNKTLVLKIEDGDVIYFRLSGGIYYPDAISSDTSQIVKNASGTYTRTAKNGTIHKFSTSGKLTSIRDKNGNTCTLTYTSGYLASITDSNGRTTTITNTSGKISAITEPGGRTYTLAYTNGNLTSITDPIGNIWLYTYNSTNRMLTKTDPLGNKITYTYDGYGRIRKSKDSEGKTKTMNYTQSGETTFTEKDGGLWTYQYDPIYSVKTAQTDPLGNTTHYTYDAKRNLTSTIAPDGSTTSYTYDAASNMTSVTDPLGNTTSYTYNGLNLVATSTDPKGGTTSYAYDAKGNLTSVTDPTGAVTQYAYDAKGNIISITDARGKTTTFAYDAQNNLISITDPLGKITSFTYDAVGNRLTMTNPMGGVTNYVYNALNQMTQVTDFRGKVTNYTYDYKGNVLSATDANGNPTNYTYNYRGQVTQVTDALNNLTQMSYGPGGCGSGCGGTDKLAALTDALNHTTAYTYDTAGRLTQETDPEGGTTSYTYDANGNMLTKTKPDGRTINYYYDAAGRLLQRSYPNSTVNSFTYDQNGNMTMAANAYIAYYYSYDAANRLTGVTDSLGRSIDYSYDQMGNRLSMTAPGGQTTSYTYNNAGRIATIANYTGAYTFSYDDNGRRTGLAYPNGVAATYSYDANGNLTGIVHSKGGTTIAQSLYTYDNVNNRITKTDSQTATYTYDAIYRLTGSTQGEAYTYDAVGNRLTGPASDTYSYNAGNELLNLNTNTYSYDDNGNRISKTQGGITTTYAYDDENRLVQVSDGTNVVSYTYDPFGRRIEKNVNGVITQYLYDQESIILEYENGNITARYTHGLNIDEPLALEKGGQTYFYHADGLGSITALTNSAGTKVQSYTYDSFGNITPNGTINQPFTYTAREFDQETGLYYYRARYYDAKAGRFVTKDPIGFEGGDFNLYNYVKSNPINYTDPEGLFVIAIPPILIYGPPIIGITWMLLKEIAKNPPKLSDEGCKTGKWTCTAHCQCTPFGPRAGESQWYVYGMGSGSSQPEAAAAAINSCKPQCTRNSYPRHCDTDKCWKN